jgi:hypothetical protein
MAAGSDRDYRNAPYAAAAATGRLTPMTNAVASTSRKPGFLRYCFDRLGTSSLCDVLSSTSQVRALVVARHATQAPALRVARPTISTISRRRLVHNAGLALAPRPRALVVGSHKSLRLGGNGPHERYVARRVGILDAWTPSAGPILFSCVCCEVAGVHGETLSFGHSRMDWKLRSSPESPVTQLRSSPNVGLSCSKLGNGNCRRVGSGPYPRIGNRPRYQGTKGSNAV